MSSNTPKLEIFWLLEAIFKMSFASHQNYFVATVMAHKLVGGPRMEARSRVKRRCRRSSTKSICLPGTCRRKALQSCYMRLCLAGPGSSNFL